MARAARGRVQGGERCGDVNAMLVRALGPNAPPGVAPGGCAAPPEGLHERAGNSADVERGVPEAGACRYLPAGAGGAAPGRSRTTAV